MSYSFKDEMHPGLSLRRKLENHYFMGVVDTKQYNMLLKAFDTDGMDVKLKTQVNRDRTVFVQWTIVIETTWGE